MNVAAKMCLLSKMGSCTQQGEQNHKSYGVCPKARYWEQSEYHYYMQHFGEHFSHKGAKWAVSKNEWNNGKGAGEYWTCEQVEAALKGLGVHLTDHNRYDAYYLANSMYADHAGAAFTDTQVLQLVVDRFNDKDGYEGMVFNQWVAKAMDKCWQVPFQDFM